MEKQSQRFILIKEANGTFVKRRILTIFQLEDTNKDYVIFYDDSKDIIKDFFVASYDANTNFKNINTNLSENELKCANMLINAIKEKNA